MTTLNDSINIAATFTEEVVPAESLWSGILGKLGNLFGKTLDYLTEDMGPVDEEGNYDFTGWHCL